MIILIGLGVVLGVFSVIYILGMGNNLELFSDEFYFFLICSINLVQLYSLVVLTKVVFRRFKSMFMIGWLNFVIGYVFSLLSNIVIIYVFPKFAVVTNPFFEFAILPIVIFIPLLLVNCYIEKRVKKLADK